MKTFFGKNRKKSREKKKAREKPVEREEKKKTVKQPYHNVGTTTDKVLYHSSSYLRFKKYSYLDLCPSG